MTKDKILYERCDTKCEVWNTTESLAVYEYSSQSQSNIEDSVLLCETCQKQKKKQQKKD